MNGISPLTFKRNWNKRRHVQYRYKRLIRSGRMPPPVATRGVDVELHVVVLAVEHCPTSTQFAGIVPCILAKV